MPFISALVKVWRGASYPARNATCALDGSSCNPPSWSGKCIYNSNVNSSPGCLSAGTCTTMAISGYTKYYPDTLIDMSSVGKQVVLKHVHSLINSDSQQLIAFGGPYNVDSDYIPFLGTTQRSYPGILFPSINNSMQSVAGLYTITKTITAVDNNTAYQVIRFTYYLNDLTTKVYSMMYLNAGSVNWACYYVDALVAYEASPVLYLPLDYNTYVKYNDLRKTVGFMNNGQHPGWNASDIINTAQQIFPSKPWAVYDDTSNVLYVYGLDDAHLSQLLPIWNITPYSVRRVGSYYASGVDQDAYTQFYTSQYGGQ